MSTLTINEVRRRLQLFAKEHKADSDEKQHAQQFWRDFYACFGLSKSSAAMFEARVIKTGGARGYIDSFIPSVLLVEQKSLGRNLNEAYKQAQDYFYALENEFEKPQYIVCCDFQTFHLYNLHGKEGDASNAKTPAICSLQELHKRADWFMFLADDKRVTAVTEELPVNRKAAEQISKLHDALLRSGYKGKDLETFLTRLLFCLFADDTGIFGSDGIFAKLVADTREDGSDLGSRIALLFEVLNTPRADRQTRLDEALNEFEYVNGDLFAERISTPIFDFDLRTLLVHCSHIDWSGISPAIFGSMFQSVLESGATDNAARRETRRELGAHYTSERNILKVIEPLFLSDLQSEYERAKGSKARLKELYDKLPTLKFLDPACGCGNFLVIAYRELRRVENDVINDLFFKGEQGGLLDIATLCRVNVGQFYGIEIDEAAAHIARVALYITDHQLNLEAANKFGETRATVPLVTTPHIHRLNALRIDWNEVLKASDCNYVFGNPPFSGAMRLTAEQREDLAVVFVDLDNYGVLDYVSAWFWIAAKFISESRATCAFVSTNSIFQGEQVSILWSQLFSRYQINIHFAHQSFKWRNEGKGVAAVHCSIVGFGKTAFTKPVLYSYKSIDAEPVANVVSHINAYLVEASSIFIENRSSPICNVPAMRYGSMPRDDGQLILTEQERDELIAKEPKAESFIRPFIGGDELIGGTHRYVLWLVDVEPQVLSSLPRVMKRVQAVRDFRLASKAASTRKFASTPQLFCQIAQPTTAYLAFPRHSSEKRMYLPVAYFMPHVIASDALLTVEHALPIHFSVINSSMHNAWIRTVSGRLESRYRYSKDIVYNNFVWPTLDDSTDKLLSPCGQNILDTRAEYPNASLAELYNPLTMPVNLVRAHEANNKAVDAAYGYKGGDDDASRVAFLFQKYERLTSLLPITASRVKRVKKVTDDKQTTLLNG
jgi:type I restriction-modification system DNA methylase subunit